MENIETANIDISAIVLNFYQKIVTEKTANILKMIDISSMVTEKINGMDTLELEQLILEIMKKELNALVNLGAIIGFVLGLLNLLF